MLPYCGADPVLCKRLEEVRLCSGDACSARRLARIRDGKPAPRALEMIYQQAPAPAVVDAGIGVPSHAAQALETGGPTRC
ncbi:hypothetical protein ACNKHL_24370 [Shigella flexneri]